MSAVPMKQMPAPDRSPSGPKVRKAYAKPALTRYGSIAELTRSTLGSGAATRKPGG